ncbi:3-hydroxybutyrate dehydrogenase [Methylobacterium fujisawaense]|jgi:3-hydroxybutyrate dehydrogenase
MVSILRSSGLERAGASRPLEGRVAVVTGSTSGIGLAVADTLAAQGALIVINGLGGEAEIRRLCQDLSERHQTPVRYDDANLSQAGAVMDLVDRSARAFGPVEILVNNAGIQHVGRIEEFPPEQWEAVLGINLSAVFYATRSVLPDMRRRGWGRIVNMASAHGLVGSPFTSACVAAMHGVVGLTEVTALETAGDGITCNAVCSGYVVTPAVARKDRAQATDRGISEWEVARQGSLAGQPAGRFATAEGIAGLVSFLCRPAAASITGALIRVDGGRTDC